MTDFTRSTTHFDRSAPEADLHLHARRRDFLSELTDSVRDNPLPAALIGMGILWMFTGGSKTSIGDAMTRTSRAPGVMAGSIAKGVGKVGKSMLHGAEALGSTATGVAQSSINAVSEAAGRVGHAVAPSSGSRGSDDYGWDEENHYFDNPRGTDSSLRSGLQQRLSELFDERPLVLGAAGLALGAGIAASLPVSEPERQAFGKASDQLRNTMSDVMGQAKDIASAAVEEVEAQGINTRAIRDGLDAVEGKAKGNI